MTQYFFCFVNQIFALNFLVILRSCTSIISCSKNEMLENALFNQDVYWILLNKQMVTDCRVVKAKRCCGYIFADSSASHESVLAECCLSSVCYNRELWPNSGRYAKISYIVPTARHRLMVTMKHLREVDICLSESAHKFYIGLLVAPHR